MFFTTYFDYAARFVSTQHVQDNLSTQYTPCAWVLGYYDTICAYLGVVVVMGVLNGAAWIMRITQYGRHPRQQNAINHNEKGPRVCCSCCNTVRAPQ